jgi:hypothetical protein
VSLIHSAITSLEAQARGPVREAGGHATGQSSSSGRTHRTARPAHGTWLIAVISAVSAAIVAFGVVAIWPAQNWSGPTMYQSLPASVDHSTVETIAATAPAAAREVITVPIESAAPASSTASPLSPEPSAGPFVAPTQASKFASPTRAPIANAAPVAMRMPPVESELSVVPETVASGNATVSHVTAAAGKNAVAGSASSATANAPAIERVPTGAITVSATSSAASAVSAGDDIDRNVADVRRAIDARQHDDAKALLQQLARKLPPESITLLRLRAWHALKSGDIQGAQALYRGIVERLPDDESASINLALSHWKLGQKEEARRVVAALAERRPESESVRQALVQFGSQS